MLYITDLDYTLLQDDATLSDTSRDGILRIIEAGIPFTIATARSHQSVTEILGDIPLQLPVITINGAFINDWRSGDVQHLFHLEDELREGILDVLLSHDMHPYMSAYGSQQHKLFYKELQNEGMKWLHRDRTEAQDPRLTELSNYSQLKGHQVVSMTAIDLSDQIQIVHDVLRKRFTSQIKLHHYTNPYHPEWQWMNIQDKTSSKGAAAQILLDKLKLTPSELTVFGDQANDISMFQVAGTACAVSNAHHSLQPHATQTIGTNTDNSVIKYILEREGLK